MRARLVVGHAAACCMAALGAPACPGWLRNGHVSASRAEGTNLHAHSPHGVRHLPACSLRRRAAAGCLHAPGDLLRALQPLLGTICPFRRSPVTDGREQAARTLSLSGCRAHALTHAQARLPAALTALIGAGTLQRCASTATASSSSQQLPTLARRRAARTRCTLGACNGTPACCTHALKSAAAALLLTSMPDDVRAPWRRRTPHAALPPRSPGRHRYRRRCAGVACAHASRQGSRQHCCEDRRGGEAPSTAWLLARLLAAAAALRARLVVF
jgi:hypothetical protein